VAANPSVRTFVIVCSLLVAVIAAVAGYAGQLHWQNAFLRAELARALSKAQAAPRQAEPEAPAPKVAAGPRTVTPEQKQAMLVELNNELGSDKSVWFTRAANDREASAYQRAIQAVFEEAGWTVRASVEAPFRLRPGIFFLMAEDEPPPYVEKALAAFNSAEIEVSAGRGYRAFHERKKASDPDWRGFDMAPEQTYTVAVGRKPAE